MKSITYKSTIVATNDLGHAVPLVTFDSKKDAAEFYEQHKSCFAQPPKIHTVRTVEELVEVTDLK